MDGFTATEITKVHSFFKDGRQIAGCTNFCTETRLRRPVSVINSVHPAVCLPSLKREWTLMYLLDGVGLFKVSVCLVIQL